MLRLFIRRTIIDSVPLCDLSNDGPMEMSTRQVGVINALGSHSRLASTARKDYSFHCGSQFQPFSSSPLPQAGRACSAGVASLEKVLIVSNTHIILGAVFCITLSIKLTSCHMSVFLNCNLFKRETRSFKDSWWGDMSLRVLLKTRRLWSLLEVRWALISEGYHNVLYVTNSYY